MVTAGRSFLKDVGRSLWRSRTRFLSIFAMIALGVGFFAGINATRPDMLISADRYYREERLSDFRILSPLGFRDKDIEALRQTPGVAELAPAYVRDLFLATDTGLASTVRLYSMSHQADGQPEFNRLTITEGRLPERPGEIAIETSHTNVPRDIHIGSVLTPSLPEGKHVSDVVRSTAFTVVGRVTSPLYIDYQRGQTNIGDGSVGWYAYTVADEFTLERPTDVYVRMDGSDSMAAYSQSYKDQVTAVTDDLESLGDRVVGGETADLRKELEDGKAELMDKKADAEHQLSEGEQKLRDAEQKILEGDAELAANEAKYRRELADQKAKLKKGRADWETGRKEYRSGRAEWQKGYDAWLAGDRQLQAAKAELDANRRKLEQGEAELAAGKRKLDASLKQIEQGEAELAAGKRKLDASKIELEQGEAELAAAKKTLDATDRQLDQAEAELAGAKKTLDATDRQLDQAEAELAAAKAQLDAGKRQLDSLKQTLDSLRRIRGTLADGTFTETERDRLVSLIEPYAPDLARKIEAIPLTENPEAAAMAAKLLDLAVAPIESQYQSALKTYESGLAEYNAGAAQVAAGRAAYSKGLAEYKAAAAEVAAGRAAYDKGLADYKDSVARLAAGRAAYEKGLADYERGKAEMAAGRKQYEQGLAEYNAAAAQMAAGRRQFEAGLAKYEAGRREADAGKAELDKGKRELDRAQAKLADGEDELKSGETALEKGEQDLERELAEGRDKLVQARVDVAEGRITLAGERLDAERQIADAEAEIRDAERSMLDIPDSWFVFSRDSNPGYVGYGDDANRIGAVARIFPLFFFLVAALVCLTTMTRMVEEERLQVGTFKALGYSTFTIASKYIVYALLASALGTAVGLAIGFQVFPKLIMNAYGMMYEIPYSLTPPHLDFTLISAAIAVTTTVSAALVATLDELRATPATLMQNKAPKPGKRIFLERIKPLWRRLSFSNKVTARNIFRYKQRFLMTVIGIAGCTSLLLSGFGLKDSISAIANKQFDEISTYDAMLMLDTDAAPEARDLNKILGQNPQVKGFLPLLSETVTVQPAGSQRTHEVNLIVPQDVSVLGDYVDLHDRVSRRKLALAPDGAVISEKLAELMHVGAGDTLAWQDSERRSYRVKIAAVAENYLAHYLYMSPELYAQAAFQDPPYNAAAFNLVEPEAVDTKAFRAGLLENDGVLGAMFTETIADMLNDTVGNLNYVVMVLILSAGALAFIVLYNLTNINITERSREIATIKVLGFRDKEVSAYVYRENIVLTAIGTIGGLGLGIILHRYVMATMEIDNMMFGKSVLPVSYLLAAALTMAFSLFVNLVMYYRLIRIDMVESLKSIE